MGITIIFCGERNNTLRKCTIEACATFNYCTFLLSEEHREIVLFRNGDFVTPEVTSINEHCYENPTGNLIDSKACEQPGKFVEDSLELSN